jgi:hypothetical protein
MVNSFATNEYQLPDQETAAGCLEVARKDGCKFAKFSTDRMKKDCWCQHGPGAAEAGYVCTDDLDLSSTVGYCACETGVTLRPSFKPTQTPSAAPTEQLAVPSKLPAAGSGSGSITAHLHSLLAFITLHSFYLPIGI